MTEVPATVHVPATELAESTPEAAQIVERARDDVYSTLRLDVMVDSINLELFSGDSDLVSHQDVIFSTNSSCPRVSYFWIINDLFDT